MASTGFGKSVRSVGEDGYDLVDLCRQLTAELQASGND